MIEQGFNDTDSTIKEMADFFATSPENLESKEIIFCSFQQKNLSTKGKEETPTQVLQKLV